MATIFLFLPKEWHSPPILQSWSVHGLEGDRLPPIDMAACYKPISLSPASWRWIPAFTPPAKPFLTFFPALRAFTTGVLIVLWFYNLVLSFLGHSFLQWSTRTTKLLFPKAPESAPNLSSYLSSLYSQCSVSDYYATSPSTVPSYSKQYKATKHNRIQALLSAMALLQYPLASADQLQLTRDKTNHSILRQCRSLQGDLRTTDLKPHQLQAVQQQVKVSSELYANVASLCPAALTGILDSGCSRSGVPSFGMVRPGSIRKLSKPIELGGIAGGLSIEYIGEIDLETLNEEGEVIPVVEEVLIHPSLPGILISPQAFLAKNTQGDPIGQIKDHFRVYYDHAEWHAKGKLLLKMPYDSSYLPRITLFPKGKALSSLKAMNMSLHSSNRNISHLQKIWLGWHQKLGHLGFQHVQELGIIGYLDKFALGLLKTKFSDQPKCPACQFGKQVRKPDGTTITKKRETSKGALLKEQLQPGDRIFCDQLESKTRGRLLHTAGREPDRNKFCGSSVFVDAASGFIHVEHQVTLNASDSILAKEGFERMALDYGVNIESYHTDNGIFKSQAYVKHLHDNNQSIRYSGVGAKWQNGAAENAIRIVVTKARTMMIHAAMMWPEVEDSSLWPLAVSHAAYLYNHTPSLETGMAPMEIFSRSKLDGNALKLAHPWGCPVYVLDPKLTSEGSKIPKWQPRSRRGQYVGVSPAHAENISMVRNLTTGYLSPQYHVVHDDFFETVYSSDDQPPPQWEDMCIYERCHAVYDPI